jgi:hypothetical protein
VLYPFGYGLSYSSFAYSKLQLLKNEEGGCVNVGAEPAYCFRVTVTNSGSAAGEHSVPMFLSHQVARVRSRNTLKMLCQSTVVSGLFECASCNARLLYCLQIGSCGDGVAGQC